MSAALRWTTAAAIACLLLASCTADQPVPVITAPTTSQAMPARTAPDTMPPISLERGPGDAPDAQHWVRTVVGDDLGSLVQSAEWDWRRKKLIVTTSLNYIERTHKGSKKSVRNGIAICEAITAVYKPKTLKVRLYNGGQLVSYDPVKLKSPERECKNIALRGGV